MTSLRSRNQGFTFVEMALTLFSAGFLLSAIPSLLSKGSEAVVSSPGSVPDEAAEFNLDGFVFMNNRLPCPSKTPTNGTEDCSLSKGFVPYKTLGLPRPIVNSDGHPFAYGIFTGTVNNLGQATAKYTPQYLMTTGNYWDAAPSISINQINGLDFCAKLRSQAALPIDAALLNIRHWSDRNNTAKMTNVAWVLVDPGSRSAGGGTGTYPLFDGSNDPSSNGMTFESPSRTQSTTYDDKVRVGTLTQMFGKLRCQQLLASVSAAARETDFANDNWRVRKYLYDFRTYELGVRKQKKIQADNALIVTSANLAAQIVLASLSFSIAYSSPAGAVAIATTIAPAVIAAALAANSVVSANAGVTFAQNKIDEGEARQTAANTAVNDAASFRAARIVALTTLQGRGWFQ